MTSVLNLDSLRVVRHVILNGNSRALRAMSVQQFIDAESFDKSFAAAETVSERGHMLVSKVLEFIEDTSPQELLSLDMSQLMALLAYIRGEDVKGNDTEAAGNAEGNTVAEPK